MKNNSIIFGGFIMIVVLLNSCTIQEDRAISEEATKPVAVISKEQPSDIIVNKLNSSGTEIKVISVGSDKRGNYNPFRTWPIEPNINEWLANWPYDWPRITWEESNPMYADPHNYWKDNLDSHSSIKSGALITFVFEWKNVSVELAWSGAVEAFQYTDDGSIKVNKRFIIQGERTYFSFDNADITIYESNPSRSYINLRFSEWVDIYWFKIQ